MVLFEGDRGRGLPAARRRPRSPPRSAAACRPATSPASATSRPGRCAAAAVAARRPLFAVGYRDDPRGEDVRAAVVQEGFDTLCTAPLLRRRRSCSACSTSTTTGRTTWTDDELETIAALATQASVAIRAAQDYERMATWAAQLQSIQQLGRPPQPAVERGRDRPGDRDRAPPADRLPQRPGLPAASAQELIPVAMQGQVGEYVDETPDQLRVTLGEGITGWVAGQPDRPEPRRRRRRPAREHDPGHRGRPRRVDAARADDVRRPGPRRPRPLEARARPVQRRRPAAAGHLRQLRGPGDGQRRHDRAAARADASRSSGSCAASASSSRSPSRS